MTKAKVEELAAYGMSDEQIADFFKVGETTIKRRFGPQLKSGRMDLKISIRQKQLKVGLHDEHPGMLMFLGKVYLKQSDRVVPVTGDTAGQSTPADLQEKDVLDALHKRCLNGDPAAIKLWYELKAARSAAENGPDYRALLQAAVSASEHGSEPPSPTGVAPQ